MNRRWSVGNPKLFLTSGPFRPRALCRRPGSRILFSFILLLVPIMLTSCTTSPQTSLDISTKPEFESPLLTFYNGPLNHLNSVRRGQCPMYPSCSVYCNESLKKHGFWIGWMMACDRLMRCGRDELTQSPAINISGTIKCYDPVIRNDWWWYEPHDQCTENETGINPDNDR